MTEKTYFWEKWRALSSGAIETAGSTFLLLIAVRHFEANAWAKGILATGINIGLFFSPLILSFTAQSQKKTSRVASYLAALSSFNFLLAALFPTLPLYVITSTLAMACGSSAVPLMTQVYQDNYPQGSQGRLFSITFSIRVLSAMIFSYLGGHFLEGALDRFRWLLLFFAAAFAFASFCLRQCPSSPLRQSATFHPLAAMRFLKQDTIFRRTLMSWMLMGFGNLMILPLRVEYLANAKYGLKLSAFTVALLVGVIPNFTRLSTSPLWGRWFDRLPFLKLRFILSFCFIASTLTFYLIHDITALVIGAAIFGIAQAGGDIGWSLWVIKLAPPQHAAEYMSVHTFFTGIRGMIAPFVAFALLPQFAPPIIALMAAGLMALGAALLLPELKKVSSS
ncbi:MAG: MFS transporter [Verrucomicrobiia bacterium]